MKVSSQRRSWAKRFHSWILVGILFLSIAVTGCAGPACNDPAASGTPELKVGEIRSDVLCRGATVRVLLQVEGNHFYTMLGDFSGSLLGSNTVHGRMFGSPITSDVDFEFNILDQLTGNIERSFFAQSSGIVTVEVTNGSEDFVQGGQSLASVLGDFTIIETRFRIVDSGVEDHGEHPEDATELFPDGRVTGGHVCLQGARALAP